MAFIRFKDMELVEQVHVFGFTNIHTFEPNSSLIRLFSLIFNYANPWIFNRWFMYLLLLVLNGFVEPKLVLHELLLKRHASWLLFTSGMFPCISGYCYSNLWTQRTRKVIFKNLIFLAIFSTAVSLCLHDHFPQTLHCKSGNLDHWTLDSWTVGS